MTCLCLPLPVHDLPIPARVSDGDQVIQGLSVRTVSPRSVTLAWNEDCASQVTVSRVVAIFCRLVGTRCRGK